MELRNASSSSYIVVLRHGHSEQPEGVPSALLPHPLTAKGRRQSEGAILTLRAILKGHNLTLHPSIDTSPSLRAWETAEIIRQGLAKSGKASPLLSEVDNLTERSLGAMANLSIDEIEAVMERDPRYQVPSEGWKSNSWYRLPFTGSESLMESGIRVAGFLQQVATEIQGSGELKIIVGHGASLRHAALCLGMLKPSEVQALSMHHASPILIERTEDGKWIRIKGEWKVRLPLSESTD